MNRLMNTVIGWDVVLAKRLAAECSLGTVVGVRDPQEMLDERMSGWGGIFAGIWSSLSELWRVARGRIWRRGSRLMAGIADMAGSVG